MCLGEHNFEETVLGDTVDSAPMGFLLHYIFRKFFIRFKYRNSRGFIHETSTNRSKMPH